MISAQRRNEIRCALGRFRDGNLAENARNLLDLLRYTSNRTLKIDRIPRWKRQLRGTSTRCMGLLRRRFALWSKRTNVLPVGAV